MDGRSAITKQPAKTTAARINGLDGLRGLAALMIFLYHAWGHSGFPRITAVIGSFPPVDLTNYVMFCGQGVAVFFVLSGFLLSLAFWQELQGGRAVGLGDFFRRRFLRIYPAYLVVVLVLALIYDVAHPLSSRIIITASHLLLLHNLTEATIYNISAPLWSVATEFQLYVILPLIFLILKKLLARGTALPRLLVGLFVVSGCMGVLFWGAANALLTHVVLDPRLVVPQGRVIFHSPIIGLANFCAGIVAGYFYVVLSQDKKASRGKLPLWEIAAYVTFLAAPSLTTIAIDRTASWSPTGWPFVPCYFLSLCLQLVKADWHGDLLRSWNLLPHACWVQYRTVSISGMTLCSGPSGIAGQEHRAAPW